MNFIFQRRPLRLVARLAVMGVAGLIVAGAGVAPAQEDHPSVYQVKAAFLLRFGQFVQWPNNAFARENSPLVIGVFGDDPFHGDLERMVAGQEINDHPVAVRQIRALSDLKGCRIVFLPASARAQEHEVLSAVDGKGVLTVGETDDFYDSGGMIRFVIEDDKVHFEINNAAAQAAGLKISSKLLTLARPRKPPE